MFAARHHPVPAGRAHPRGERHLSAPQALPRARPPEWIRARAPGGAAYLRLKEVLRRRGLHTVCEEARCPNLGECWAAGDATFMLLGDVCTRACRFCAVATGNPRGRVDPEEPLQVAQAVAEMGLRYVVLTTVDRDDLPDGGATHVAKTVRAVRERTGARVEALTGDFGGDRAALAALLESRPDCFAHNVETVPRLHPRVRDRRASYERSLAVLAAAREPLRAEGIASRVTKSSLMLGLGEDSGEVLSVMDDLRAVGVDVLTLGQYLQPTPAHLPVARYLEPAEFEELAVEGRARGFRRVLAGPLVRSSYRAGEGVDEQ
ncbi:MAG: lipoyl synthase [Planctomycetes bacterium]|nr:lipoyl synthase [Planctomycetota bacterium]